MIILQHQFLQIHHKPTPLKPKPLPIIKYFLKLKLHPFVSTLKSSTTHNEVVTDVTEENEEGTFPVILSRELMPKHVAVIMDGNVRWAKRRGYPASFGHEAGVRALIELIGNCRKWGVKVLSVYAFSSDNWRRPKAEVDLIMRLFEKVIAAEVEILIRGNIRISIIGDSLRFPSSLQKLIKGIEESSSNNSGLHLLVAASYSGQYDIVQACQRIGHKVKDGLIKPGDIDKFFIEQELETKCVEFPNPDLLIRTSGEQRLSNFMLWQLAYTELFFTQSLWPDFGEVELLEALQSYQQRQRRFGSRDS